MDADLLIVLLLLAATTVMFALNRPRMDAVALLAMTALPLTGVITVEEALSGLSDPSVVLIAVLFVLGEGLVRTGVANRVGDLLVRRAGRDERRLVALLMGAVATIGSVMSSTAVVAIFLPAVLRIARRAAIPPSRLAMPLSVAALISGMMTLIATPPNLVVHSHLVRAGYPGFHFFSFTLFGLPVLLLAIGYMLVARRWLAPRASGELQEASRPHLSQWIEEYGLSPRLRRLRIQQGSPLHGKRLEELGLRAAHGIDVLAIERQRRFSTSSVAPAAQTVLEAGDVLYIHLRDPGADVEAFCWRYGLVELQLSQEAFSDPSQAVGMAELMIPATSRWIGKSVIEVRFRSLYRLSVIGMKRGAALFSGNLQEEPLRLGDTLLVAGPWRAIARLKNDPNELIVLNVPEELDDVAAAPSRAPYALAALAVTVGLMVTAAVPNVLAALIGVLLLGLFRCIDLDGAYRSIRWETLVLIVGMLPFSLALQKTGGVDLAVAGLLHLLGRASPMMTLAALYALTVFLGLFISNTATAVLMAPVALALAQQLELSPLPFAMIVALASSAAFVTPVSSPVNALVVGPGNYRFMDFVRVGVPLSVLVAAVSLLLARAVFPF